MSTYAHECVEQNAEKFVDWILHRGGIAVWQSVNLSNPGASWSTPALTDGRPTPQPTWQADSEPAAVHTDPAKILVRREKEVRRFRVGLRRKGFMGLTFVLTDGAQRRLYSALDKLRDAGQDPRYHFDRSTQEVVITVPDDEGTMSLADWIAARDRGAEVLPQNSEEVAP